MEMMPMEESILTSIKVMLGLDSEYDPFDNELVGLINSAIGVLTQLGVGTPGFRITGKDETWASYIGDADRVLGLARDFIHLRVKQIWDPTANSTISKQVEEQLKELTYRILLEVEAGGE